MSEIDFKTKELLARARLELPEAARRCGLKPAQVFLCVRGLSGWHPDERKTLHSFLSERIERNRIEK